MVYYYTYSRTQGTTSSLWTKRRNSCIQKSFWWSRRCWNLTRAPLSEFWDNILISAASRKALQKFSRELIVPNTANHGPERYSYYAPRTDFYVDNMISPNYFKNQFRDTFGSVAYVLEFCGKYFCCFLFIKLIVDIIVMILRGMEINRLTGASFGFAKTLLSASYKLFLTSILTSVFNHQAPLLQTLEPEPTPTRMEEEPRDPADENKKKRRASLSDCSQPHYGPFSCMIRIIRALFIKVFY